jgi:site-specific recombinase XerD
VKNASGGGNPVSPLLPAHEPIFAVVFCEEAYVFVTERGGPMSTVGFHHLIQRLGEAAKMPFSLHPHMLRHACGYKLANDGHDTRALQHYLGHKNIQHTVRYTELSPDRFRDFWRN